jgi:prepilin-type N-terminal cleavage/methylation domain-containing protein
MSIRIAQQRRGITLLEMLAVIAMIAVLVGIAAPIVGAMRRHSQVESGRNAISAATKAVRGYTTQGGPNLCALTAGDGFSGVGMLFTPQSHIRLIENTQLTRFDDGTFVEANGCNDFTDIPDRDYVTLPKNLGVAGIVRLTNGSIEVISPPFGILFNKRGQIVHSPYADPGHASYGNSKQNVIYYDGNYDDSIPKTSAVAGSWRGNPHALAAPYNPELWNPNGTGYVGSNDTTSNPGNYTPTASGDPDANKAKQPFDAIETVVGVIMFNNLNLQDDLGRGSSPLVHSVTVDGIPVLPATTRDWILSNGDPLFVSPYTGQLVRMPATEE